MSHYLNLMDSQNPINFDNRLNPVEKPYPTHGVIGKSAPGWCDLGALHHRPNPRAGQSFEPCLTFRRRKLELEKLEDGCNSTLCKRDHSRPELPTPDFNEGKRTSEMYHVPKMTLPERFENPGMFNGYGWERDGHPFYVTTSSQYGRLPPNVHTVPIQYFPIRSELQEDAVPGGKRNRSLNVK